MRLCIHTGHKCMTVALLSTSCCMTHLSTPCHQHSGKPKPCAFRTPPAQRRTSAAMPETTQPAPHPHFPLPRLHLDSGRANLWVQGLGILKTGAQSTPSRHQAVESAERTTKMRPARSCPAGTSSVARCSATRSPATWPAAGCASTYMRDMARQHDETMLVPGLFDDVEAAAGGATSKAPDLHAAAAEQQPEAQNGPG